MMRDSLRAKVFEQMRSFPLRLRPAPPGYSGSSRTRQVSRGETQRRADLDPSFARGGGYGPSSRWSRECGGKLSPIEACSGLIAGLACQPSDRVAFLYYSVVPVKR